MSLSHKYIMDSLNTRFNLCKKNVSLDPENTPDLEWSHICLVTQDWDELNEFIYKNELSMTPPLYFSPQSNWGCILLPKIKFKWTTRAKQVEIGCQLYNVLEGVWDDSGAFIIDKTLKIYPYFPSIVGHSVNTILIPFKTYTSTNIIPGTELPLKIGGETLECVYAGMHCSVNFNRQGLYINRKFRDKVEQMPFDKLPEKYSILEPAVIELNGLIINLSI